jgi:hypothetical protein
MDISLDIQASSASVIWFEKLSRDHQLSWRKLLKIIILNFILYIIHFCFVWRESLTLVSEPTSRRIIRWLRFQSFIWKSRRLCNDTDKDVTKNILTKYSINKWLVMLLIIYISTSNFDRHWGRSFVDRKFCQYIFCNIFIGIVAQSSRFPYKRLKT